MSATPNPPKVTFGAISTGVPCSCQYNPETLEEDLAAAYASVKIQGLSHQVLQYENTDNWKANFDMAFDAYSLSTDRGISSNIQDARNFMSSLLLPTRQAQSVATGSPTRVLFTWPGMITLTAVIKTLKFKHKRFAWTGVDLASTLFVVTVGLEEIRDTRLFADEVAARGTLRTST